MKVIITRTLNGLQPVFDSAPQLNHIDFKSSEYDERKFILPYLDINGLPLFRISLHSEYIMYSFIKFTTDSTNDRGFYSINLFYRSDTLIQNFAEILSIIDKRYATLAPGVVDPNFLSGFNESKFIKVKHKYIFKQNDQINKKGISINYQRQSFKIDEEFAYIPYISYIYLFENSKLDLASILKSEDTTNDKIDYNLFKSSIIKKEVKGEINSVEFMIDNAVYTERSVKDILYFALKDSMKLRWRYKVDPGQGAEITNSFYNILKYNPPKPQPQSYQKFGNESQNSYESARRNNEISDLKSSNKAKMIALSILGLLLAISIGFIIWLSIEKSDLNEKITNLESQLAIKNDTTSKNISVPSIIPKIEDVKNDSPKSEPNTTLVFKPNVPKEIPTKQSVKPVEKPKPKVAKPGEKQKPTETKQPTPSTSKQSESTSPPTKKKKVNGEEG